MRWKSEQFRFNSIWVLLMSTGSICIYWFYWSVFQIRYIKDYQFKVRSDWNRMFCVGERTRVVVLYSLTYWGTLLVTDISARALERTTIALFLLYSVFNIRSAVHLYAISSLWSHFFFHLLALPYLSRVLGARSAARAETVRVRLCPSRRNWRCLHLNQLIPPDQLTSRMNANC